MQPALSLHGHIARFVTQFATVISISSDKFEQDEIWVDHAEALELPVTGVAILLPLQSAGNTRKLVESGWWWPGDLAVGKEVIVSASYLKPLNLLRGSGLFQSRFDGKWSHMCWVMPVFAIPG